MTKRHVNELSRAWEHLLEDACYAYPTLADEFRSRDLPRFRSLCKARGLCWLLTDMPALAKHLDRCLDRNEYRNPCLPGSKPVNKDVVIPRFLRGLYLLVFSEEGSLLDEADSQAIFFLRQLLLVFKKYSVDCPVENKMAEVISFLDLDNSLPEPVGIWECNDPGTWSGNLRSFVELQHHAKGEASSFHRNLDIVSGILAATLGPYSPEEWRFRHGPGVVSDAPSYSNKYSWRNWSERLDSVYPICDYGYHSYSSWADNIENRFVASEEVPSRLICVPKTYDRPRLIAAEPSSNQWCQQNCWDYFFERVQSSWISSFVRFNDQTRNQELCVIGSKDATLATLDLSSASDCVTCQAVEALFRCNPTLVRALAASRTRSVRLPGDLGLPGVYVLRKYATMGNATTFPVESLLFLAICIASVLTDRRRVVNLGSIKDLIGEVAVFGDDIIIPKENSGSVVLALEASGFKVNVHKSFAEGNFRESCGVDSFRGQEVTPVYWRRRSDRTPESVAATVALANNLYKRFLIKSAQYAASTVRTQNLAYVPADSGSFGLQSRTPFKNHLKRRFNKDLQRWEHRAVSIKSTSTRRPADDDSMLLQYFTERPSPYDMWRAGTASRPVLGKRTGWVPVE